MSKARNRVDIVLLLSVRCPSSKKQLIVGVAVAQTYQSSDSQLLRRLVLHLVIRVDKVIVLVFVILALKLLVGLGEVDRLAACARAVDDVGCLDLLHVVFVGLLSCDVVSSAPSYDCVDGDSYVRRPVAILLALLLDTRVVGCAPTCSSPADSSLESSDSSMTSCWVALPLPLVSWTPSICWSCGWADIMDVVVCAKFRVRKVCN